jgi:hypothetical protein
MGHFAEGLASEVKEKLGISGDENDAEILGYARQVQAQIELLTGHRLEGEQMRLNIEPNGLPFVPTLDAQAATLQVSPETWPIADPVHPEFANVLQVRRVQDVLPRAVPKAEALAAAAALLAHAHISGQLALAPRVWFAQASKAGPVAEFGRRLMDAGRHTHVPVVAGWFEGWWLQVSRRIQIMTNDTPDDPGLVEMLAPPGNGLAVIAGEPILIAARMTEHPSDWVFAARVWIADPEVRRPQNWRSMARAVHGHGVPIVSLDDHSTLEEITAQVLLLAYWHGYIDRNEATLIPASLTAAFPRQVARVMHGTEVSSREEAAVLLFERLLSPGFDPTRGAGSIRNYITRHATTLIRAYRTSNRKSQPWDALRVSERYYYKLLARFGHKGLDGRYEEDKDVEARIRTYLRDRQRHGDAMALLRVRGFGDAAARKWLQRHSLDEIVTARPRCPRAVE